MAQPLISFGGLASGIDTKAVIDALIGVRKRPIGILQARQANFRQLQSSYQALETKLEALHNAADDLRRSTDFLSFSANSSNDTAVTASADGSAGVGSFQVTVSTLASTESEGSTGFADFDTTNLGTGTLKITLAGTEHDIDVATGEDTLEGIRDAINDSEIGVTATIVNDGTTGTPYRLVVTGNDTGAANTISFSDDLGGTGLAATLSFSNLKEASDATVNINGLDVSRSTNTINDVVPGVTLNLLSAGTSTITVDTDVESIKTKVRSLVAAHSDLVSYIDSQIEYSDTAERAGAFNGEAAVRSIKSRILNLYSDDAYPGGTFNALSDAGISVERDGTLSFDEEKFDQAAIDDLAGLTSLFTTDGDQIDGLGFSLLEVPEDVKAGDYVVNITQAATKAGTQASQAFPVGGLTADEKLTITLGTEEVEVELLAGDTLADAVSKINSALDDAGIDVTASDDAGTLSFNADSYGSGSSFSVVSDQAVGPGSTGVGTTSLVATGLDVVGTINGEAATGDGQVLTGDEDTTADGVRLRYTGTSTPASADLTVGPDGFFVKMEETLDSILDPIGGTIETKLDSIDESLDDMQDRIEDLNERAELYRDVLVRRFAALEGLLGKLQSQQAFLATYQFPSF